MLLGIVRIGLRKYKPSSIPIDMKVNWKACCKRKSIWVFSAMMTLCFLVFCCCGKPCIAQPIRVGVFNADVTPPIGSPVAYATARSITDSLSARGVVILSDEKPIVLCAVDWIGIGNEGLDVWRHKLAAAANTTIDRVSVHALHQHDGVHCDFTMAKIMDEYGMGGLRFDTVFLSAAIEHVAEAVTMAVRHAQPVTHIRYGEAIVEKVASNRRILGEDGRVEIIRWSKSNG